MNKYYFGLLIAVIVFVIFGSVMVLTGNWNLSSFSKTNNPGRCLILNSKNCKLSKSILKDGEVYSVNYFLSQNSPIFSPIDGDINIQELKLDGGTFIKSVTIGSLGFKNTDQVNVLYVFWLVDSRLNENVISLKQVKKGEIFAYTNDSKKISDESGNISFQAMDSFLKDGIFSQKVNVPLLKNIVGNINEKN